MTTERNKPEPEYEGVGCPDCGRIHFGMNCLPKREEKPLGCSSISREHVEYIVHRRLTNDYVSSQTIQALAENLLVSWNAVASLKGEVERLEKESSKWLHAWHKGKEALTQAGYAIIKERQRAEAVERDSHDIRNRAGIAEGRLRAAEKILGMVDVFYPHPISGRSVAWIAICEALDEYNEAKKRVAQLEGRTK